MKGYFALNALFACVLAVALSGCGPDVHGNDVTDHGQSQDVAVIDDAGVDVWHGDGNDRPDVEISDAADASCCPDSDDADLPECTDVADIPDGTADLIPVDVAAADGPVDADEDPGHNDIGQDLAGPDEGNDSGSSDATADPGVSDIGSDTGSDNGTDTGHQDVPDDPGSPDVPDPCAGEGQPCFVTLGDCRSDGVEVCLPDLGGTECNAAPIVAGPEVCDGVDNDCDAEVDNIADALQKRAVLNCFADASRTVRLPVADCWNLVAPDTGVLPAATVQVDIQFVDAATPCDPANGINMCVSSAITTCTQATLTDACVTEMAFEILLFGTQYRYTAASDNISFGFDKSQDSVVGAIQFIHVPPDSPSGCTILYNTFSCPECN